MVYKPIYIWGAPSCNHRTTWRFSSLEFFIEVFAWDFFAYQVLELRFVDYSYICNNFPNGKRTRHGESIGNSNSSRGFFKQIQV